MKVSQVLSLLFIFILCTTGIVAASNNDTFQMGLDNVSVSASNNPTNEQGTPESTVDSDQIKDYQAEEENASRNNSTNLTDSTNLTGSTSSTNLTDLTDLNNSIASVPASLPVKSTPTGDNIIEVKIIMNNVTITGLPPEQAKNAEVKTIPQADLDKTPINNSIKKTLPYEQEVRDALNASQAHNYSEVEALALSKHWYADRYYMTFDTVYNHGEAVKHTNDMIMDVIYINQPEGKGGYGRIGVYADQNDLYDILPEPFAIGKPVTIQSMSSSCRVVTTPVRTAVIKWKHLGNESMYTVKSEPSSKSVQVVVVKDAPIQDKDVNKTPVTSVSNTKSQEASTTPDIKIENYNNTGDATYIAQIFNMFNNIKIEAQNIYINIVGK